MLSFLRAPAPGELAAPVDARAAPAWGRDGPAPSPGEGAAELTFDGVYAEYFDYVWRSARRLGVRPSEIDDVIQEIFLAVHKLLPKYEEKNIRGWLYAIVVRTVLHHHRSMRRLAASRPESELIEGLAGSSPCPEISAEAGEHARVVEQLLDGLDPEKRAVLVLAGIEQKALPEIAEILQINVNTASSRLRAAREQIQAGLARHEARDRWRIK